MFGKRDIVLMMTAKEIPSYCHVKADNYRQKNNQMHFDDRNLNLKPFRDEKHSQLCGTSHSKHDDISPDSEVF